MRFDKFTIKSQELIQSAQSLASRQNNQQIEPEHLLSAMLAEPQSVAASMLRKLGVSPGSITNELSLAVDKLPKISGTAEVYLSQRSKAVLEAAGSVLTNKYAEGYPGARYYGGCEFVDVVERLAIERAKKLFGAEHANVQPHSGSQANSAVFMALCQPGDTILGMSLADGGHLTHGAKPNFSGKIYHAVQYGLNPETGEIDYDEVERLAQEHRPRMIVAGFSAYSGVVDWQRFRDIADAVGAYLFVDMAHVAGLVAAGVYPSPVQIADVTTTTTHKTLRGPRGGLILAKSNPELEKKFNSLVFPGTQGGPLMHVIAAKAVCFLEAMKPEFTVYQQQVAANAKVLAAALGLAFLYTLLVLVLHRRPVPNPTRARLTGRPGKKGGQGEGGVKFMHLQGSGANSTSSTAACSAGGGISRSATPARSRSARPRRRAGCARGAS